MSSSSEEKVPAYHEKVDAKGVSSDVDSEANQPVTVFGDNTLHRTMKNRHIAMIRYKGTHHVPQLSLIPALQYRRCHWHRSFLGYRLITTERGTRWPSSGLHHRWIGRILGHGLTRRDGCLPTRSRRPHRPRTTLRQPGILFHDGTPTTRFAEDTFSQTVTFLGLELLVQLGDRFAR